MKSIMFRVRIEPELKERLQAAVRDGIAKSMSDVIRLGLDKLLDREAEGATIQGGTPKAKGPTPTEGGEPING